MGFTSFATLRPLPRRLSKKMRRSRYLKKFPRSGRAVARGQKPPLHGSPESIFGLYRGPQAMLASYGAIGKRLGKPSQCGDKRESDAVSLIRNLQRDYKFPREVV
jgi:hypothetical protein